LLGGHPDNETITVYLACISRAFLSKFGFPNTLLKDAYRTSATPIEPLVIQQKLVPCQPLRTLEQRLLAAMGKVNSSIPHALPDGLAEQLGLTAPSANG